MTVKAYYVVRYMPGDPATRRYMSVRDFTIGWEYSKDEATCFAKRETCDLFFTGSVNVPGSYAHGVEEVDLDADYIICCEVKKPLASIRYYRTDLTGEYWVPSKEHATRFVEIAAKELLKKWDADDVCRIEKLG